MGQKNGTGWNGTGRQVLLQGEGDREKEGKRGSWAGRDKGTGMRSQPERRQTTTIWEGQRGIGQAWGRGAEQSLYPMMLFRAKIPESQHCSDVSTYLWNLLAKSCALFPCSTENAIVSCNLQLPLDQVREGCMVDLTLLINHPQDSGFSGFWCGFPKLHTKKKTLLKGTEFKLQNQVCNC